MPYTLTQDANGVVTCASIRSDLPDALRAGESECTEAEFQAAKDIWANSLVAQAQAIMTGVVQPKAALASAMGQQLPDSWKTYVAELVAIIAGTASATALPPQPTA